MQQLWHLKLNWDDDLSDIESKTWAKIYKDLKALDNLHIPRWTKTGTDTIHSELHGFADASNVAYGAAVYL